MLEWDSGIVRQWDSRTGGQWGTGTEGHRDSQTQKLNNIISEREDIQQNIDTLSQKKNSLLVIKENNNRVVEKIKHIIPKKT